VALEETVVTEVTVPTREDSAKRGLFEPPGVKGFTSVVSGVPGGVMSSYLLSLATGSDLIGVALGVMVLKVISAV